MLSIISFVLVVFMIVTVVPLVLWIFFSSLQNPKIGFAFALILSTLSLTQFGFPSLRYSIGLFTIPFLLSAFKEVKRKRERWLPSFSPLLIYIATCAVSIIWSLSPQETAVATAAWVALVVFIFTFRTLIPFDQILKISFLILMIFLALSIAYLMFDEGWANGRARGLFTNANTAGMFTFFTMGLALAIQSKKFIAIFPIGFAYILLTGSRAALAASIVMLVIYWALGVRKIFRIPLTLLVLSFAYPVASLTMQMIASVQADDTSVLRTNNSREGAWTKATDFIQANPLLGAGYGAAPEGIGSSSYFKLLAEFGLGFSLAGIFVIFSYLWFSRKHPALLALTFGVLVNTAFEDWLLTAGSPLLAFYLVVLFSLMQTGHLKNDRPNPPSHERMQTRQAQMDAG